jgi:hypothetical protein
MKKKKEKISEASLEIIRKANVVKNEIILSSMDKGWQGVRKKKETRYSKDSFNPKIDNKFHKG